MKLRAEKMVVSLLIILFIALSLGACGEDDGYSTENHTRNDSTSTGGYGY